MSSLSLPLLAQAVANGILFGGIYAAISLGLGLVWGVMRILNIGHAALAILGAYLSLTLVQAGVDPLLSLLVTMPALAVVGVALQFFVVEPMHGRKEAEQHASSGSSTGSWWRSRICRCSSGPPTCA